METTKLILINKDSMATEKRLHLKHVRQNNGLSDYKTVISGKQATIELPVEIVNEIILKHYEVFPNAWVFDKIKEGK